MAMNSLKPISSILFLLGLVTAKTALASDPDILSDFIAPTNTSVDGKFFTFTGMRRVLTKFPQRAGVSYAVLQYPANVGFVDTKNVLYTQSLQVGDMFIFPKGLVHYQYIPTQKSAIAISSFGSANAGTVSVPLSVFSTGIDDDILAKAFKTDLYTIQKIKSGFGKP
ncbi:hypothetical protein NC652_020136 [Populus alba x Populus x berolinensis]|nr:hypothetical protein NC652_020136 [Populus alba x Populus x berolinensis]